MKGVMRSFLDHITVTAWSLEAGAVFVRDALGVLPQSGGAHPRMATHNMLLRLGMDTVFEASFLATVDRDAPLRDQRAVHPCGSSRKNRKPVPGRRRPLNARSELQIPGSAEPVAHSCSAVRRARTAILKGLDACVAKYPILTAGTSPAPHDRDVKRKAKRQHCPE